MSCPRSRSVLVLMVSTSGDTNNFCFQCKLHIFARFQYIAHPDFPGDVGDSSHGEQFPRRFGFWCLVKCTWSPHGGKERERDVHWSQRNKNAAFAWTWSRRCNGIKLLILARALLTNSSMIHVTLFCFCSSGKLSTWQILQKSFIIIDHFRVVLFTSLEQTVWFNWWSACGLCSQMMTSDTKLLSVLGGSSTSL